jgi:hypothetical protein
MMANDSGVDPAALLGSELDRPITGELYFGGYAGLRPNESFLAAARRVLKELAELEKAARAAKEQTHHL